MAAVILRGEVPKALSGSGSGYGSGDGYGYGSGDGYGYGSGYGYGYGYGYGSGSGSGSGYGDGDGSGSGSGYGDGDYWRGAITYFLRLLPDAQRARAKALQEAGALLAFWRSDANGCAANGGRNKVHVGTVERERGPLRDDCGRGQLHATLIPTRWHGDRWWIVALIGERRGDDEKCWALEREVIGECL